MRERATCKPDGTQGDAVPFPDEQNYLNINSSWFFNDFA